MRLDSESLAYLRGDKFSNGERFHVDAGRMHSRNSLLGQLASDKTVLHYGCADHIELIEKKRASGMYLHDLLSQRARRLVGSDINAAALEEMSRAGIKDLYVPGDLPRDIPFDLVMAPDVIEHVPDVGRFLAELAAFGADVVITTPNAFRLLNRRQFGSELINTDHRYWFSPYTLVKSLMEAGYEIQESWYTDWSVWHQPLRTILKRRYPLCRDGLAVLATPPS